MNKDFSQLTKNYLIESFNKHSTGNLYEEFLREFGMNPGIAVDAYNKRKPTSSGDGKGFFDNLIDNPENTKRRIENQKKTRKQGKKGSGFGVGGGRGEKGEGVDATGEPDNILFGDTESDDLGIGSAALAYGAGTGLEWLGQLLGNKAASAMGGTDLMKKVPVLGKIPGAVSSLFTQGADIAGKGYFDTNIGKIASNAEKLAVQGAGSPWVPLYTSTRAPFKPTQQADPLDARRRAVEQRKLEAEEKKYGITP